MQILISVAGLSKQVILQDSLCSGVAKVRAIWLRQSGPGCPLLVQLADMVYADQECLHCHDTNTM
jgi:hypothetical protein